MKVIASERVFGRESFERKLDSWKTVGDDETQIACCFQISHAMTFADDAVYSRAQQLVASIIRSKNLSSLMNEQAKSTTETFMTH